MLEIFYFRGLNTYGDERLHLGPFTPGTHHGPITEAFKQQRVRLNPVLGMGSGPLEKIISNAKESLTSMPEWKNCKKAIFFGHSTGALVARALSHDDEISQKVKTILSLGGPHEGCNGADRAMAWAKKPNVTVFFCKMTGWNLNERVASIENLSIDHVALFNQKFPLKKDVEHYSWLCNVDYKKLSWAMKFLARIAHRDDQKNWIEKKSDGLVFSDSQKLGEVLGHSQLDHLSMIGHFFFTLPSRKKAHQKEFKKMVESLARFLERQTF